MGDTYTSSEKDSKEQPSKKDDVIIGDDKRFVFYVIYKDPTGQKFKGKFVSRIPNVQDILKIGSFETEYFGKVQNIDAVPMAMQNFAFMISTLKVCLVDWPEWFDVDKIEDEEVLSAIYTNHALVVDRYKSRSSIEVTFLAEE